MVEKRSVSAEQQRVSLSERLWLGYFNSYLYEKGTLTESERNKMILKIECRKGSASGKERQ